MQEQTSGIDDTVIYLINLDESRDRLARAIAQLEGCGLPFVRVSAFDGRSIDPAVLPQYDRPRAIAYMGRQLLGAEFGCYFSHTDCVRRFLATGARYALVLEDDVLLGEDFAPRLLDLVAWLDDRREVPWYLINLGSDEFRISTPLHAFGRHVLHRAHYFSMTTTAVLWSRVGAEAFLQESATIFAPVDNFLRYWVARNGFGLALSPRLAATTEVDSLIRGRQSIAQWRALQRSPFHGLIKKRRLLVDKWIAIRNRGRWRKRDAAVREESGPAEPFTSS